MKNLLLLIFCIIYYTCYTQIASISTDLNNIETSSFYDEKGIIRINLTENYLQLFIDLDNYDEEYESIKLNYKLSSIPILLYNQDFEVYNILFDLQSIINEPIGGLIDFSSNSILLFYDDGSSLLYIGEGITIII